MKSQQYGQTNFASQIAGALAASYPPEHTFTTADLAGFDQFHTRGLAATADLAVATEIATWMRVLDVGSGLGGPARFLATTYGCTVVGVDASAPFVEVARMLTERSATPNVTFEQADALVLPFVDATFDLVWMQHVAMNIGDRPALYREIFRVLRPGGRFATYDVVRDVGEIAYPMPWARDEDVSFLLTENETRTALADAGFDEVMWHDETDVARTWFASVLAGPPAAPGPINLGMAMGLGFADAVANLGRNLARGALGIVAAVMVRP